MNKPFMAWRTTTAIKTKKGVRSLDRAVRPGEWGEFCVFGEFFYLNIQGVLFKNYENCYILLK